MSKLRFELTLYCKTKSQNDRVYRNKHFGCRSFMLAKLTLDECLSFPSCSSVRRDEVCIARFSSGTGTLIGRYIRLGYACQTYSDLREIDSVVQAEKTTELCDLPKSRNRNRP